MPLSKEMVFSLPLLKKIVISLLVDTANSEIFHIEKQVSSNSKTEKKSHLPTVDPIGISKRMINSHIVVFIPWLLSMSNCQMVDMMVLVIDNPSFRLPMSIDLARSRQSTLDDHVFDGVALKNSILCT